MNADKHGPEMEYDVSKNGSNERIQGIPASPALVSLFLSVFHPCLSVAKNT